MRVLLPIIQRLIITGSFLLPLFPPRAKGEHVAIITSNELMQARSKLLSESWEERNSAVSWFARCLKSSPQADFVAQFLLDSYPIVGTNASQLLMDCQYWDHKSPGLRDYAKKLYSEASACLSTNNVDDFERFAGTYYNYDKTNAARVFARDLPRVPFFDYLATYHWSAKHSGRGARGLLARSIGYSGDEKAISALAKFLNSPEVDFRRIAAYGLGRTDNSNYIGPLQERLKIETEPRVRVDLRQGIENCAYFSLRVRAEQLHPLVHPLDGSREAEDAIFRQNDAVLAEIRQWLTNGDEQTRVLAAYASRSVSRSSTADHLEALRASDSQDKDARFRLAIRESADWHAEEDLDSLEGVNPSELLQHPSCIAQLAAIESNPLVSPKLQKRANDLYARVKVELAK